MDTLPPISFLQKLIKTVLVAMTALCGSVGAAADQAIDDPVALDSVGAWSRAKPSSGRPAGIGASGALVATYSEGTVPIPQHAIEVSSAHLPDPLTWEEAEIKRHTAFGAGSFALSALGLSASVDHRQL
jgi:hypothetical protein